MTDNNLIDCQLGLIHSHNSMATFFSQTDLNTLRDEGKDRNHFVSLIVNNEGTYTAAITRKIKGKKKEILDFTYNTFNDELKHSKSNNEVDCEVIQYSMLNIIKQGASQFDDIDARLAEIKKAKAEKAQKIEAVRNINPNYLGIEPIKNKDMGLFNPNLFPKSPFNEKNTFYKEKDFFKDSDITVDAKDVKALAMQLITGSIVITESNNIDMNNWAAQRMVPLFDKRFNKDMLFFENWVEMFVEFLLTYSVPQDYEVIEENYMKDMADAVYLTLNKLPKNDYLEIIKEKLLLWN
jgi:hypothetical protein